ncbi:MAG: hypothetical protein JWR19_442 [Pedosphaera sp.]|nr:hypothetical protein [Pedosphaera sp.]
MCLAYEAANTSTKIKPRMKSFSSQGNSGTTILLVRQKLVEYRMVHREGLEPPTF